MVWKLKFLIHSNETQQPSSRNPIETSNSPSNRQHSPSPSTSRHITFEELVLMPFLLAMLALLTPLAPDVEHTQQLDR